MNKKVIKAMLVLVVLFLTGLYILKIFFPEKFVMVVTIDNLVKIGDYIDNNTWAYYLFGICTSFVTYWLYFCSTLKKWYLNLWQTIVVFAIIGATIGISFYDTTLSSVFSMLAMLIVPILFKGDTKYTLIVFSTHYFAQSITLKIRQMQLYIAYSSSLSLILLTLECYFWLLLFYVLPHIKEKGNMGWQCPPLYGKIDKDAKKIAKIDKKIAKLNEERAIYAERIEKSKDKTSVDVR